MMELEINKKRAAFGIIGIIALVILLILFVAGEAQIPTKAEIATWDWKVVAVTCACILAMGRIIGR